MQEAIPYLSARPFFSKSGRRRRGAFDCAGRIGADGDAAGRMRVVVAENPAVVLGRRGCCMCHVASRLLLGLGVNPVVCEFGEEAAEEAAALVEGTAEIEVAGGDLRRPLILPAVFVGGRLLGGLDRLLAVHITGELVPILKEAGALWL
ncbi:glutaredoxin-C9-like [Curcuma longa]|uniref:glutaredoxin-C9-like n=1 Tax=Curcuma longa TaxID=136217 RepID=UPI003D9F24EE